MDPFLAEIRIMPFNLFVPKGWAFCDGQILSLSQNTALFSLLETHYGGDGIRTFALPNMQGNVPMHPGNGAGLTPRFLGEQDGSATVTLLQSEIPMQLHDVMSVAGTLPANTNIPTSNAFGKSVQGNVYAPPPASGMPLANQTIGISGNGFPHNNMQPYITLSFCIALQGVFPPRS
jgi:microcystin-dependent protein